MVEHRHSGGKKSWRRVVDKVDLVTDYQARVVIQKRQDKVGEQEETCVW